MNHKFRMAVGVLGATGLLAAMMATGSASISAVSAAPTICTGTAAKPGSLVGGVYSAVKVTGVCDVNAGQVTVTGAVTVGSGGSLLAVFANNAKTGKGISNITVVGDVNLQSGATLLLGCEPDSACFDDPNQKKPTLSSADTIGGSLIATGALGVIVHNAAVGGSVSQSGGGGGVACTPKGIFTTLMSPVFSAYEDLSIGGDFTVKELKSCWLGVSRVDIGASMKFVDNKLKDPDAIEIVDDNIRLGLSCTGNSRVWDSTEKTLGMLFPRTPRPDHVGGTRSGQCVLSSPTVMGGPSGPGPF